MEGRAGRQTEREKKKKKTDRQTGGLAGDG